MRKTLVLLAVGMTLAACRDPEPHPHLVKAEGVQVQIEDPPIYSRSGSLARIRMPMANDPAYAEASQALMDIVAGREVTVDESSGGLRVSVGGEDLARAVVAAGWARPLDASAEPELARAEAEARQARRGGWSPAYRELAHRWLRARALDVSMSDAHLTDAAARMQLRWYAAKGFAKDQLALFEVDFDDRDAAGTRPSCADQVSAHAAATLTAGPASARSAFAEGAELARVVESGTAACEAWRVAGNALVRGDERRPFALLDDGRTVEWQGYTKESSGGGMHSSSGSVMKDPLPVNASGADGLLIGITVWFTSQAACERALSATFPTGCSEPR